MLTMSVPIIGIDHPNKRGPGRRFELQICTPGEPVELKPEPNNQFDEHAIAVFSCRGLQIGYLPSERAVLIGVHMRHGRDVTAIFQGMSDKVGWCRIAFDGEVPTLPPAPKSAPRDDSGFEPDPIYDD